MSKSCLSHPLLFFFCNRVKWSAINCRFERQKWWKSCHLTLFQLFWRVAFNRWFSAQSDPPSLEEQSVQRRLSQPQRKSSRSSLHEQTTSRIIQPRKWLGLIIDNGSCRNHERITTHSRSFAKSEKDTDISSKWQYCRTNLNWNPS